MFLNLKLYPGACIVYPGWWLVDSNSFLRFPVTFNVAVEDIRTWLISQGYSTSEADELAITWYVQHGVQLP